MSGLWDPDPFSWEPERFGYLREERDENGRPKYSAITTPKELWEIMRPGVPMPPSATDGNR